VKNHYVTQYQKKKQKYGGAVLGNWGKGGGLVLKESTGHPDLESLSNHHPSNEGRVTDGGGKNGRKGQLLNHVDVKKRQV